MRKGFTLVELLAVIVILAVIALIATPTVLNMIEDAREGSAIQSINGILDAADNYIMSKSLKQEEVRENIDLTKTNLEYKGTKPEKGTLLIDSDGEMSVIAKMGKYCIEKKFNEEEPHIIESETCEFEESETIKYEGYIALNKSGNDCVTDNSKTCTAAELKTGLKVSVNVNDNETYDFYVISDNGAGSLNLLLDHNIGAHAWASVADYNEVSDDDCDDNTNGCNMQGPVTALKAIKSETNDWTNIENRSDKYIYKDATIDMKDYKARLMITSEAQALGCLFYTSTGENKNTCPSWFEARFWLMPSVAISETWVNHYKAAIGTSSRALNSLYVSEKYSIIPVITISKNKIK